MHDILPIGPRTMINGETVIEMLITFPWSKSLRSPMQIMNALRSPRRCSSDGRQKYNHNWEIARFPASSQAYKMSKCC